MKIEKVKCGSWRFNCQQEIIQKCTHLKYFMRGFREWDRGSRTPWKNHKNIGFLSNTCPDPLENQSTTRISFVRGCNLSFDRIQGHWHFFGYTITQLPSQHSMLGHHRSTSETSFKCYLDPLSPNQLKKTLSELDPLWQTFWIQASIAKVTFD